MGIERDEVGLLARFDRADMLVEAEHPRVAEGHAVEGMERRPRLPVELQDLVALSRRVQHRIARPAADIGRERDPGAGLGEPRFINSPGPERMDVGQNAATERLATSSASSPSSSRCSGRTPTDAGRPYLGINVDVALRLGERLPATRAISALFSSASVWT